MKPCVPLLQIFDLSSSLKFYCDVLGFQIAQRTDHDWWAMLKLGDAMLMLNTISMPCIRTCAHTVVR